MGFTEGCLPANLKNSFTPYILPWSVIANAGIPSASAFLNSLSMDENPSRIEYWVCT